MKQHTPEEFRQKAKAQMRRWAKEATEAAEGVGNQLLVESFESKSLDDQIAELEALRQLGRIDRETDILALRNSEQRTSLFASAIKAVKWQPKSK